ncbi:MAG TPA: SPOR domain-containing protein [Stellaceae bacterium]|nr:SPOR domain-containing protein [Stellaceae bacterium]
MAYAWGPSRPDKRYERLFIRRRSRRWLLVMALVLPGIVGAGIAAHRIYAPTAPAVGDVPLIRADGAPTRKRPDAPGGLEIAGQGTLALDGGHGASQVEHLLPGPETPLPPPTPAVEAAPPVPPPTVAASPPPVAVVTPPPPVATAPTVVTPEPATPLTVAAPVARSAKPAPLTAAPLAKPAQVAAMPPALKKGYRLQLGAVRDPEMAKRAWERVRERNADLLGHLTFVAERVDLGGRGVFYRIQAGPLADEAHAARDCKELKRRGVSCILVRP